MDDRYMPVYTDKFGRQYTDPDMSHKSMIRPLIQFPNLGGKSERRVKRRNTVQRNREKILDV